MSNVGTGPMHLPGEITPVEALQDFTARTRNSADQAARAHADAVRQTMAAQQKNMLRRAIDMVRLMRRQAGR